MNRLQARCTKKNPAGSARALSAWQAHAWLIHIFSDFFQVPCPLKGALFTVSPLLYSSKRPCNIKCVNCPAPGVLPLLPPPVAAAAGTAGIRRGPLLPLLLLPPPCLAPLAPAGSSKWVARPAPCLWRGHRVGKARLSSAEGASTVTSWAEHPARHCWEDSILTQHPEIGNFMTNAGCAGTRAVRRAARQTRHTHGHRLLTLIETVRNSNAIELRTLASGLAAHQSLRS